MATPAKKSGSKKVKRNVPNGVVHIQSTFNNTIVSISDTSGEVISWSSAGASGFKGARKGTPFAAQTAAEACVGQLVLTHLSPRYAPGNAITPNELLEEAKAIFPNTLLAKDFLQIDIKPGCNSS